VKELWEDCKNLPNPISDPEIEEILTKEIELLHPGFISLEDNKERLRNFVCKIRNILDYLICTEEGGV